MKRYGKMLGLPAVLAAVLFAVPSQARASEGENGDVKAEMRKLQRQIIALRKLADVAEAEAKMTEMELTRINERLDRIERTPGSHVVGDHAPFVLFEPSAPLPAGTVRLSNRLPVPAYVTANGATFSVAPFGVRTIANVPAGPLTYEVSAPGYYNRATTASNLGAGEMLTVNINAPTAMPLFVFP